MTRGQRIAEPDPAPTEDRQTQIIHAVWQVIATSGMDAVTMRTVAAAAGVSVGRIQYWFHTKDELLHSSLAAMLSSAARRHAEAVAGVDEEEALWRLISHSLPRSDQARTGVSVFHHYVAAAINHPELARMLAEAKDGAERQAARHLRRVAPAVSDPLTAARSLIATADGLTLRVLIGSLSVAAAERTLRTALRRTLS